MQSTEAGKPYNAAPVRHSGTVGENFGRCIRYRYLRLVRIKATPHAVATGLAVGVFIGFLPVMPLQTVLALIGAIALRGSKIAALLGTWVSNPLSWAICYPLFYYIGKALVPFDVPPFDLERTGVAQLLESGWRLFAVMMIGGLVVAVPSAVASYVLALKGLAARRARRKARFAVSSGD